MLFTKPKPKHLSQTGKVLQSLKNAGLYGQTNYELSKICLSWHRRIGDLRRDGHKITCIRITKGTFKYFLDDNE